MKSGKNNSHNDSKDPTAASNQNQQPRNVAATISGAAWGSLRPPSVKDVTGPRKRRKALDAPPPLLDYLIVLDFEWTASDKQQMEPTAEITQFPSVLLKVFETKHDAVAFSDAGRQNRQGDSSSSASSSSSSSSNAIPLPSDLTTTFSESEPSSSSFLFGKAIRHDALAISAFDTFVRPTCNPRLTDFSIRLTAITQEQVNHAPTIEVVLKQYVDWLQSNELVDAHGTRQGNWCFVTWGDGDIMSTLRQELRYKHLDLPCCFDRWINLKSDAMFKKHYKREPRGGLRACVESVGATWEGRAHNGLVDSINTAKIVRHMLQTGFRFTRSTRGLGKDGIPFGQQR